MKIAGFVYAITLCWYEHYWLGIQQRRASFLYWSWYDGCKLVFPANKIKNPLSL